MRAVSCLAASLAVGMPTASGATSAPERRLPPARERIRAFCIDFNWGPGGINGFAPPGLYAGASPKEHLAWCQALGVNTIQTFCVSCCGYAWYRSGVAPVMPGMAGDFLNELTTLAHREKMRVMGYFCVGANTHWGQAHPELSHGTPSAPHIPLTTTYLDYLCSSIQDALRRTAIDGFMVDWVWSPRPTWLACEREMYAELFGEPFTGPESVSEERIVEFGKRAVDRCWGRIRRAAKAVRPGTVIWLSCSNTRDPQAAGSRMFREVDWLMNEHPDPALLDAVRREKGPRTQIVQCLCGWGDQHDARRVLYDRRYAKVGYYGFAAPDPATTLPPPGEAGNARNIEIMRRAFQAGDDIVYITPPGGPLLGQTPVALQTPALGVSLHYTLDGSVPSPDSPRYRKPLRLDEDTTLTVALFRQGHRVGEPNSARFRRVPIPEVLLTTLEPLRGTTGWKTVERRRNGDGGPLNLDGHVYKDGMGVASPSELAYRLEPAYRRFVALVGIDRQQGSHGTITVQVLVDGRKLYESALLRGGDPPLAVDVALPEGGREIVLVVTDGGDDQEWDLADWVHAGFMRRR